MKHLMILTVLVTMSQQIMAVSACHWQIDESGHSKCLSLKGEDEALKLDEEAKKEGKLPKAHEECKGKRTLSINGGMTTFGCEE